MKDKRQKRSKTSNKKSLAKKPGVTKITCRVLGSKRKNLKAIPDDRGVVYLKHIPHGFYEDEMRKYFSQFGKVTGVNVVRSKRTGKSRGFAFVEFLHQEVAKIVAETMDNYVMFKRVVKAKYIPPEEQKPYFFKFPNPKIPLVEKRRILLRAQDRIVLDQDEIEHKKQKLSSGLGKMLNRLRKQGIEDYEIPVAGKGATL